MAAMPRQVRCQNRAHRRITSKNRAAPRGTFVDRIIWLSSNIKDFIVAWVVQIIAMLSLSAVIGGCMRCKAQ